MIVADDKYRVVVPLNVYTNIRICNIYASIHSISNQRATFNKPRRCRKNLNQSEKHRRYAKANFSPESTQCFSSIRVCSLYISDCPSPITNWKHMPIIVEPPLPTTTTITKINFLHVTFYPAIQTNEMDLITHTHTHTHAEIAACTVERCSMSLQLSSVSHWCNSRLACIYIGYDGRWQESRHESTHKRTRRKNKCALRWLIKFIVHLSHGRGDFLADMPVISIAVGVRTWIIISINRCIFF